MVLQWHHPISLSLLLILLLFLLEVHTRFRISLYHWISFSRSSFSKISSTILRNTLLLVIGTIRLELALPRNALLLVLLSPTWAFSWDEIARNIVIINAGIDIVIVSADSASKKQRSDFKEVLFNAIVVWHEWDNLKNGDIERGFFCKYAITEFPVRDFDPSLALLGETFKADFREIIKLHHTLVFWVTLKLHCRVQLLQFENALIHDTLQHLSCISIET